MGHGGSDRYAAHLRWCPRRTRPGGAANRTPDPGCAYGSDEGLRQESGQRSDHGRPHLRQAKAVSHRRSGTGLRAAADPGPILAAARGVYVAAPVLFTFLLAVKFALAVTFALAIIIALPVAFAVRLVIPVEDGLRPVRADMGCAPQGSRVLTQGKEVTALPGGFHA